MRKTPGTSIWLSPGEKKELEEAKKAVEAHYERAFDWGSFLVGLATGAISSAIVAEAIKKYRERKNRKKKKEV